MGVECGGACVEWRGVDEWEGGWRRWISCFERWRARVGVGGGVRLSSAARFYGVEVLCDKFFCFFFIVFKICFVIAYCLMFFYCF